MSKIPEHELEATRAALAPTLQAAADILPLLVKAHEPRFPPEMAERWHATCARLVAAWSDRHGDGDAEFRPAVIELCACAVELNDGDCLRLAEALASASDCLEDPARLDDARLLAALAAASECLSAENVLEHPSFSERARHLAERLEQACKGSGPLVRTPTLDRIFVSEASERVDAMIDALELLPPDAYAIKSAAEDIIALAEPLELHDIIDRARVLIARLKPGSGINIDLDDERTRNDVLARITLLENGIGEMRVSPADEKSPGPIVFPPPTRPPR